MNYPYVPTVVRRLAAAELEDRYLAAVDSEVEQIQARLKQKLNLPHSRTVDEFKNIFWWVLDEVEGFDCPEAEITRAVLAKDKDALMKWVTKL